MYVHSGGQIRISKWLGRDAGDAGIFISYKIGFLATLYFLGTQRHVLSCALYNNLKDGSHTRDTDCMMQYAVLYLLFSSDGPK